MTETLSSKGPRLGDFVFYDRAEGELFIGKIGRWTLAIRLPKVKLYRRRHL